MSKKLKLSIITPNYNYSNYLGKLIESICEQDYENWEHIIVDDGSTDNSIEIIEAYARREKRIKLIKQENKGQTAALNRALKAASGDLIAWINSDDWYCRRIFKTMIREFEEDQNLDILYGDGYYYKVDSNKKIPRKQLPFNYKLFTFNGFCNSVMSNTTIWRRELLSETGNFSEDFTYNMDGEFFARLFWNHKIKHVDLPVAYFRWHDESKTIKNQDCSRSERYEEESKAELVVSLMNLNRLDLAGSRLLRYYKKFYKIKRIFLRFIHGHYFNINL